MELDDDQDTHICLKCQTTIIGLDNYVAHKKKGCLVDKTTQGQQGTATTTTILDGTTYEHIVIVPVESSTSDILEPVEADKEAYVKPDDFFLSLELQSSNKMTTDIKKSPSNKETPEDAIKEEEDGTEVSIVPEVDDEEEVDNGAIVTTYEIQKSGDIVEDPLSADDASQELIMAPGPASKKPLLVIGKRKLFARRPARSVSWSCPTCDVSFKKENQLVNHLASSEHWQQSKNHPNHSDLIFQFGPALVTQSLYKCSICSFYCNSHEDFLRHWGSPMQESHINGLEQHGGGFQCLSCNFECHTVTDMEEHLKDPVHAQSALSQDNPVEVRFSSLRCPKCDWTTDKHRALQSHIKLAHAAKTFFHCNICEEDFAEEETLLAHWKADEEHWSKCHKCIHCSFVTDRMTRLAAHLKTVHKDDAKTVVGTTSGPLAGNQVNAKSTMTVSDGAPMPRQEPGEGSQDQESARDNLENNENNKDVPNNRRCRKQNLNTVHLCMFCGSKQDTGLGLKEHVTRHHPEHLIRCLPCCATFVFETQYQKHLASRVHQCNVVGENDDGGASTNNNTELFICDQCPFQCRNRAGILFHQTMHAGPVSDEIAAIHEEMQNALKQENEAAKLLLMAKAADVEFLQDVTGSIEMVEEDEDEDDDAAGQPLGPEDINGMDKGKGLLNRKRRPVRKKRPDRIYCCPLCDKMFTPFRLRIHLNVHTGECPFVCTICGMSYTRKDSLYSHHRNTHKEKQYTCPQCPYRSSRKGKINEHILTHKVRPRKFLCDTCGAGFYKKYSLLHHQKLHTGVKLHKCDVPGCARAFRCPSELVYHKRVHTDERPFLCDTCGYAAKTRHQLTKHERTHTGARPFPCPHCSYSAALGPQLRRHMRIHTGTKPYSCPHCPYTCNTQENLRKHVLKSKKHQGLNVYTCPHCDYGCDWAKEMKEHLLERHAELSKDANEDSPSFSSSLTGIYDREVDKTRQDVMPIPYVPRTEKRATLSKKQTQQQPRVITLTTGHGRTTARLEPDGTLIGGHTGDGGIMIPVVIEELGDASEDQIACEKLNEIISITGEEVTLTRQSRRRRATGGTSAQFSRLAKRSKKSETTEEEEDEDALAAAAAAAQQQEEGYEVAIIEEDESSSRMDNGSDDQMTTQDGMLVQQDGEEQMAGGLVMQGEDGEQIVLATPEDVENFMAANGDNAELYHLLQGTQLMKSEIVNHDDQEIAVFTIELPADHEDAILGLEDDSGILAAIPSDAEQQMEGMQSAILVPFGSVITTGDNPEEQTLAFIQEDSEDPKGEGNTVLFYMPISS